MTTAAAVHECIPPTRTGATPRTARGYACGKDDYLRHCVRDAARRADADPALAEVAATIRQVVRLRRHPRTGAPRRARWVIPRRPALQSKDLGPYPWGVYGGSL